MKDRELLKNKEIKIFKHKEIYLKIRARKNYLKIWNYLKIGEKYLKIERIA